MWAKKILLLSCLYPLALFFVILYTNAYTTHKSFSHRLDQTQEVTLADINFVTPVPTVLVLPEKSVVSLRPTNKPSIVTKPLEDTKSSSSPKTDLPSNVKVSSNAAIVKESSESANMPLLPIPIKSNVELADETPPPTQLPESQSVGTVSTSSVAIDEQSKSSVILPSSSSTIVSQKTPVSGTQSTATVQY